MSDNNQNIDNNIDSAIENLKADVNQEQGLEQNSSQEQDLTQEQDDQAITPLQALEQERDSWQDKALRAMADAENTRRIAIREKQDLQQSIIKQITRDLLLIADSFERALLGKTADDADTFLQGIFLTYKELNKSLEKQGVKKIVVNVGDSFDHNFHQAMGYTASDEVEAENIAQVIQTGYTIGNNLLRPTLVMLAKTPDQE
jgi:molecular chaperone GrpE